MKIHLIMPMGGAGSRFYKDGYIVPKPLIEINGAPFMYWATMSIKKYVDIADLTFVVLREHIEKYQIDKVIRTYFPEAIIKELSKVLPGPVFTALKGVEHISDDAPILFNDCDHMFRCNEINSLLNKGTLDADGVLLTFESDQPQFSYVRYDADGNICGTVEKKVVSSHAICGAYIFKNVETFRETANRYIDNCPYSECFMSGLYNTMCSEQKIIRDYLVDFHVEFGTPEEYEEAKKTTLFSELM